MSTLNVDTLADELGTGGPDFVGMPTVAGDPVVESGSNTDGEWTRWADGTQVVGGIKPANQPSPTTHGYPQGFLAGNKPRISMTNDTTTAQYTSVRDVNENNFAFESSTSSDDISYVAYGFWK